MKQLLNSFAVLGLAGLLLSTGKLCGQSKEEFRRKYGEPLSEAFMVRPGIRVTATYAANGRITELLISPSAPGLVKSRGATLTKESVESILDELVPSSVRGKYLVAGFMNLVCLPENDCGGASTQYQNLTIYYNAGREGGLCYAVVQWKE